MKTFTELRISREELYRRVWESPMREVAAELGISDVGLKKTCRREGIPTPPQGYHLMADEAAKKRLEVPLPKTAPRHSTEFVFRISDQAVARAEKSAALQAQDVNARASHPLSPKQRQTIDLALKTLRGQVDVRQTDRRGMVVTPKDGYPIRVSPQSFGRAFGFVGVLLTRFISLGAAQLPTVNEHGRVMSGFKLQDFDFHFEIEETSKRIEIPPPPIQKRSRYESPVLRPLARVELRPTGMLSLSVWGPARGGSMKVVRDGARLIEECVDQLVEWAFSQCAVAKEEARIERTRRQRAVAYLQEKDKPRLEAEFQRLRRRQLQKEALQWRQATALRQYVAAVEEAGPRASPLGATSPEGFQEWLVWAKAYADSLDPISRSEAASDPSYPEPDAYEHVPRIFLDYDDPGEADRMLQKEPWRRY